MPARRKLTDEQVQAIRDLAALPQRHGWRARIAKQLGVSQACVTMVINGKRRLQPPAA
jgi:predicted transcriptional regulator